MAKKGDTIRVLAYTNPITWFVGFGFVIGVIGSIFGKAIGQAINEYEKELEESASLTCGEEESLE